MITKEIIKKEQPCSSAFAEVLEKYGNKFKVSYMQLLEDFPQHQQWIQQHLYKYREKLSPSYGGKFKLNQFVYRQHYGIANYTISRIDSIELGADKKHFVCMVTTGEKSYQEQNTFNRVEEDNLFPTLNELKQHWHNLIDGVQ